MVAPAKTDTNSEGACYRRRKTDRADRLEASRDDGSRRSSPAFSHKVTLKTVHFVDNVHEFSVVELVDAASAVGAFEVRGESGCGSVAE